MSEASLRRPHSRVSLAVLGSAVLVVSAPSRADERPKHAASALVVTVVDATTGEPVVDAAVRVAERAGSDGTESAKKTDSSGRATFWGPTERAVEVKVERAGYATAVEAAVITARGSARVTVGLIPDAISAAGEVIEIIDVFRPSTVLAGAELQQHLASSVPASLAEIPGFAVGYNGPGAASPSIRGMAGDRVLVLEDGARLGDLYWSASDHGVMTEAITSQRIEVVRGPAGLVYGANALGGVVNVVRDDIPRALPDGIAAEFTSQLESASGGASQGATVTAPVGPVAIRVEESTRRAGDTRTPDGVLDGTDVTAVGAGAGIAWQPAWGVLGSAVRYYRNEYGVPGEFGGELIPGGHPGGARIEATRLNARARAVYRPGGAGLLDSVELDASATRYQHDEIEGILAGEPAFGARFTVSTLESSLVARHVHDAGGDAAVAAEGAIGGTASHQQIVAGGASPGMRTGDSGTIGAFAYEELVLSRVRLQAGARYDYRWTAPERTDPIDVRTMQRRIVKPVTARRSGLLSGSLAAVWTFAEGWSVGANVARSSRAPTLQELYADGPHLADFSFDIGSPDLRVETGNGADLFLRAQRPHLSLELAVYYNHIDDYIYYAQTGETVRVIREGLRPRDTPVFEAQGADAVFMGAEGRARWELGGGLAVEGTASYTHAERRSDDDPLPFISPLSGRVNARYSRGAFTGSIGARVTAAQRRVPRAIQVGEGMEHPQQPTDGYALVHAAAGWRYRGEQIEHAISLRVANLTDRSWRDHLSRIKDVAPQPGRNVFLTYHLGYW